jgi:transketolase
MTFRAPAHIARSCDASHSEMAEAIRVLAIDSVESDRPDRPSPSVGLAHVATVLFSQFLKFDSVDPAWPDRDRLVFATGQNAKLRYALFQLAGYGAASSLECQTFRRQSHVSEYLECASAVDPEATTGPRQEIAIGAGMAIAERLMNARFGNDFADHYSYVIGEEDCLRESINREAIVLAGQLRLSRLILLLDDSGKANGETASRFCSDDTLAWIEASGWSSCRISGVDPHAIAAAIDRARRSDCPSLIVCRSAGSSDAIYRDQTELARGSLLASEADEITRRAPKGSRAALPVPEAVLAKWRQVGRRGGAARRDWIERTRRRASKPRSPYHDAVNHNLPFGLTEVMNGLRQGSTIGESSISTQDASERVIEGMVSALPNLLRTSAILARSESTRIRVPRSLLSKTFECSHIHPLHSRAVAGAVNGVALHGGFIPYCDTHLGLDDNSRCALDVAAKFNVRVIHLMAQDLVGAAQDALVHRPIAHLASLRAVPNLLVFRPGDAVETVEAWECALRAQANPSVIYLSQQMLPTFRKTINDVNHVAFGAYVVLEPENGRDVTLIATGSEVSVALEAAKLLESHLVRAAVVSAPCFELFSEQPQAYRAAVLGDVPRIGIEAGPEGDWKRWIGDAGKFVCMLHSDATGGCRELGTGARTVATIALRCVANA